MLPLSAIWHVLPVDDAFEHREGMDCPCLPRLQFVGVNGGIIVHNAFDGREADEAFVETVADQA